jgi:hypothetical protein
MSAMVELSTLISCVLPDSQTSFICKYLVHQISALTFWRQVICHYPPSHHITSFHILLYICHCLGPVLSCLQGDNRILLHLDAHTPN